MKTQILVLFIVMAAMQAKASYDGVVSNLINITTQETAFENVNARRKILSALYKMRAFRYYEQAEYSKSEADYRKAAYHDPENILLDYAIAKSLLGQAKYHEAREMFLSFLASDYKEMDLKRVLDARLNVALCSYEINEEEGIIEYAKILEDFPDEDLGDVREFVNKWNKEEMSKKEKMPASTTY